MGGAVLKAGRRIKEYRQKANKKEKTNELLFPTFTPNLFVLSSYNMYLRASSFLQRRRKNHLKSF